MLGPFLPSNLEYTASSLAGSPLTSNGRHPRGFARTLTGAFIAGGVTDHFGAMCPSLGACGVSASLREAVDDTDLALWIDATRRVRLQ